MTCSAAPCREIEKERGLSGFWVIKGNYLQDARFVRTVCMSELDSDRNAERSRRGIAHGGGGRRLIHTDGNDHVRDGVRPHPEQILLVRPACRARRLG